jgi:hypothetical protein
MLTATYHSERENIKIRGEISDFVALHSTVRKVMLEAASYEQEHHEVSDFLVGFLEKLETAYSGTSQAGKFPCPVCQPFPDVITLRHQELLMLGRLLNGIAQYTEVDNQDQACLLLIDSFIYDVAGYPGQLQPFRDVKAFVASFPRIMEDCFSKH